MATVSLFVDRNIKLQYARRAIIVRCDYKVHRPKTENDAQTQRCARAYKTHTVADKRVDASANFVHDGYTEFNTSVKLRCDICECQNIKCKY